MSHVRTLSQPRSTDPIRGPWNPYRYISVKTAAMLIDDSSLIDWTVLVLFPPEHLASASRRGGGHGILWLMEKISKLKEKNKKSPARFFFVHWLGEHHVIPLLLTSLKLGWHRCDANRDAAEFRAKGEKVAETKQGRQSHFSWQKKKEPTRPFLDCSMFLPQNAKIWPTRVSNSINSCPIPLFCLYVTFLGFYSINQPNTINPNFT